MRRGVLGPVAFVFAGEPIPPAARLALKDVQGYLTRT